MIRVLIVDDAQLIRSSVRKSVGQINDTIVVAGDAANGAKAAEWLSRHYADLLITDIKMPAMNGLELIDHINQSCPWMASLVISSYDDFSYARQSIQLRALDYILKPIDEQLLRTAVLNAASELISKREQEAAHLMLRKLPSNRKLMDEWIAHLKTTRIETLPSLIVDTLELLEEWAGADYYKLNALSSFWIKTVYEEMNAAKLELVLEEGKDLGLGTVTLPLEETRFYFRLCAVRRLEEGAYRLLEAMREVRDDQTVKLVSDVKAYIHSHYNENINLQTLADHVALNKTYMCTLFKQETNMTVWNYIVTVRLNQARDLLVKTSDKVYEIANRVGYEDVNYFSQLFKKHFGLSPLDYRKRMVM